MMKTIGLGMLALCLLATVAPLAAADITVRTFDQDGDHRCESEGEYFVIPAPVTRETKCNE